MNKEVHPEDNINISAIRSFVISLFRGFFKFLSFSAFVCRTKKLLLFGGLITGLFLGMFYYYVAQTRYYQASMLMIDTKMPVKVYAGIIEQLNMLAKTNSLNKLSSELKLTPADATNILYFESRNMMGEPLESDTSSKLNQPFQVIVGIRNNNSPDSIQNALVNYFNNLPYLQAITAVQHTSDSEKIQQITADLERLDTLKMQYNKFIGSIRVSSSSSSAASSAEGSGSAPVYNDAINPAQIYAQTLLLMTERDHAKRELYAESNALLVVDRIKTADTVKSKSLPELLVILGGGGLLLAFLIGTLIEIRKKVLNDPA
jgi:hypothetical protein